MKKVVALILSLSVAMPMVYADSSATKDFPDVSNSAWYYADVNWAADNGLVKGYPDGSFKPEKSVTEAEFLAMLMNMCTNVDKSKIAVNTSGYQHWSMNIYNEAKTKYNLPVKGYTDDAIKGSPVNRGLVAQVVAAKYGFALNENTAVDFMYSNLLSQGLVPGIKTFENYLADGNLTRAQAAAFLKRTFAKDFPSYKAENSDALGKEMKGILGLNLPIQTGRIINGFDVTLLPAGLTFDQKVNFGYGDWIVPSGYVKSESGSVSIDFPGNAGGMSIDLLNTAQYNFRDPINPNEPFYGLVGKFSVSCKNYTAVNAFVKFIELNFGSEVARKVESIEYAKGEAFNDGEYELGTYKGLKLSLSIDGGYSSIEAWR